ncbi:hypothetical protein PINS_up009840 [Pythium insidiosum]|nr:hypothetical protein PINS_up009840 [Pythium insidiosum]
MKIGVVSDLTGGADICSPVTDLSTLQANAYLGVDETVLFALSSPKEEYSFTNEALITICGDSAMSSKRMVLRFEYQTEPVRHVRFETCGVTDRDCELKFVMGAKEMSIDIVKAEQAMGQRFYRVLLELSRVQTENLRRWEFAKLALDASVRSMTVQDATGKMLVEQATNVHTWYAAAFEQCNPRCYRDVLQRALAR